MHILLLLHTHAFKNNQGNSKVSVSHAHYGREDGPPPDKGERVGATTHFHRNVMSAHILAVAQLLLLFPIAAFGQQVQLPPLCQSQCATFSSNFARCATNTTPNNRGQWNSAALTIANCICPVIESDTSCQNCVVQNYGILPASFNYPARHGSIHTAAQ